VAARKTLHIITMTRYNAEFKFPVIFPPANMENVLSEWLSKHKLRQFHAAETEKYAHVTFFFNGGKEEAYPLEDRKLIDSPKVATFDLVPEMSMSAVADAVVKALGSSSPEYPFVMCNLAAPDMVGHTGKYEPTVLAVEACDRAIAKIWAACQKSGHILVITADHGNAEEMLDAEGKEKTSHTTNLVPLIIASHPPLSLTMRRTTGGLADVAPTLLTLMGLDIPKQMTGSSLVILHNTKLDTTSVATTATSTSN